MVSTILENGEASKPAVRQFSPETVVRQLAPMVVEVKASVLSQLGRLWKTSAFRGTLAL